MVIQQCYHSAQYNTVTYLSPYNMFNDTTATSMYYEHFEGVLWPSPGVTLI